MNASNLPPGVTDNMIPGNTPEDRCWENFWQTLDGDIDETGMNDALALEVWNKGLYEVLNYKELPTRLQLKNGGEYNGE